MGYFETLIEEHRSVNNNNNNNNNNNYGFHAQSKLKQYVPTG